MGPLLRRLGRAIEGWFDRAPETPEDCDAAGLRTTKQSRLLLDARI
jgi:hypothetical protein